MNHRNHIIKTNQVLRELKRGIITPVIKPEKVPPVYVYERDTV